MGDDMAYAIAIDFFENVYVTGRSEGIGTGYGFATVAYDTFGNELWVERLNGSGNGEDHAWDISVDTSGSVFVAGTVLTTDTSTDYLVVKYKQ